MVHGLGRGVKQRRQRLGEQRQPQSQQHSQAAQQSEPGQDRAAGLLGAATADGLSHSHGRPHGQSGDQHCKSREEHTAGGYAGDIGGGGKLSDHQQVHSAVERLQKQREQNR